MEIRIVPVAADATRSRNLVARRLGSRWRRLRGRGESPQLLGCVHWPVDLVLATAEVRLPFRSPRTVRIPLARDGVTGRQGELDQSLPAREVRDTPESEIVADRADWAQDTLRDFAWDQVVRRYRPSEIRGLRFEHHVRAYLPYHLVRESEDLLLVDLLAGRVERAKDYAGVTTVDGAPLNGRDRPPDGGRLSAALRRRSSG